jgi:hypothetical protein
MGSVDFFLDFFKEVLKLLPTKIQSKATTLQQIYNKCLKHEDY